MKTKNLKLKISKAFTLLEMLVVIGIIAVLVSMGIASYSTAQKKARDAKRKSDLKTIQTAFEQYYAICGYNYPLPATGNLVPTDLICLNPNTTIASSFPVDPKSGNRYTMTATVAGSDYTICAPNSPPLETESTTSYCLTNQQ